MESEIFRSTFNTEYQGIDPVEPDPGLIDFTLDMQMIWQIGFIVMTSGGTALFLTLGVLICSIC